MSEQQIEQELQARGLNAPRLTPELIEAQIKSEHYFVAGDGIYGDAQKRGDKEVQSFPAALDLLTICVLVLRNDFTIIGKSACASPENFNADIGRKIAREDAKRQIWALEGYVLRTKLAGSAS